MKKYLIVAFLFAFLPFFASAYFDADLSYGSKGESVKELQEFLIDQGLFTTPSNGNFYSLTLRAVKAFQIKQGIAPASGYFGPKTRAKANDLLAASGVSKDSTVNEGGFSPNMNIQASDFQKYLSGIGRIDCADGLGGGTQGSATIWDFGGTIGYVVLTNAHVLQGINCNLYVQNTDVYHIDKASVYRWNLETDISIARIEPEKDIQGNIVSRVAIKDLNYGISKARKCPVQMAIGSPVVVLGFPAFAVRQVQHNGIEGTQSNLAVTNGIISATDDSTTAPLGKLPYSNYFVSTKIDSGNSGGISFSKDEQGLCVLGIPTWLSIGHYETQGILQNIANVMFRE